MSNELLWFLMLAINFLFVLLLYRRFGKNGLYAWMPVSIIIANIQVTKIVAIFGMSATLGNIAYAGSFLVTDILSEQYGKQEARRAIGIGFVALIGFMLMMNFALFFRSTALDTASEHIEALFRPLPRIVVASLVAYVVSQLYDVQAYAMWRRRFPTALWFRNNASTLVSQIIDTIIFTTIAFWGTFPPRVLLEISATTYLFKAAVALVDTPFIYLARRLGAVVADKEEENA